MPARYILFLDGFRLGAFRWHNGRLDAEAEFAADAGGQEEFAAYLSSRRQGVFHLLADVAEEGFQYEEIPFVRGNDRTAILTRKLGQYFYGTSLSVAVSLGRAKEGRRDERLLFAGLTRPQHFEPWISAIQATEARLAGIYTVPQMAETLAESLGTGRRQFLLITITRGGLRQTFIENGRLRFSRLTVLATGSRSEMAVACGTESAKIYQYLAAQRLVARGTALPTLVLAQATHADAIRSQCRDTENLHYEYVDLAAEARRRNLRNLPTDGGVEFLLMHLLARRPPAEQFAHGDERKFFKLWRLKSAILAGGTIALAGCLLYAGKLGVEYLQLEGQARELRAQAEAEQNRYAAVLGGLPRIPLKNDELRLLVSKYDVASHRSPPLEPLLQSISLALQADPRIELTRLAWSVGGMSEDAAAAAPVGDPRRTPAGKDIDATVELQGNLPLALAADHRAQLEAVESFASRLRAGGELRVEVLRLPFEVESGKALRSAGDAKALTEQPRFSIRVMKRIA